MDTRLSGPPYRYDHDNRERGGLVTRQTLVKKDPYGFGDLKVASCSPDSKAQSGESISDLDGCAFRKAL